MNYLSNTRSMGVNSAPSVTSVSAQAPSTTDVADRLKWPRMPRRERDVVEGLLRNDAFVARALVELHWKQEEDEQAQNRTIYRNGVGFNAADAKVFSPMAEEILRTGEISAEQLAICRRPLENGLPWLGRYRRQLARLIEVDLSTGPNGETNPDPSEEEGLLAA